MVSVNTYIHTHIYIYIYMCVCVVVGARPLGLPEVPTVAQHNNGTYNLLLGATAVLLGTLKVPNGCSPRFSDELPSKFPRQETRPSPPQRRLCLATQGEVAQILAVQEGLSHEHAHRNVVTVEE